MTKILAKDILHIFISGLLEEIADLEQHTKLQEQTIEKLEARCQQLHQAATNPLRLAHVEPPGAPVLNHLFINQDQEIHSWYLFTES